MKKTILTSTIKTVSKSNASIDNPNINTVSFILTDAEPNANGVGIRREDFIPFAQSAIFMPIKMTEGNIEDHFDSKPVGTITQTEIDEDKVYGSGVLWPEERPADVALIKDKTEKGEAQISWEISYEDDIIDDGGIVWLQGPKLLAATLVKFPAYQGRTPITSFASDSESNEEEDMTEEVNEELNTEEVIEETDVVTKETEVIEDVKETVENTEKVKEDTEEEVKEDTEVTEEKEEEDEELAAMRAEIEELRNFKMFTERSKIVTDLLGELEESDVKELVSLTDSQLKVVKRLVSSKKKDASIIPNIPGIEQKTDALSVLKRALEDNTGGN